MEFLATPATKILAGLPSPRFVKTHLPMSLLPPKMLDTAKVLPNPNLTFYEKYWEILDRFIFPGSVCGQGSQRYYSVKPLPWQAVQIVAIHGIHERTVERICKWFVWVNRYLLFEFWSNINLNCAIFTFAVIFTPYFEHIKEAWALRNHPNMLFLFYEDLSKVCSCLPNNLSENGQRY